MVHRRQNLQSSFEPELSVIIKEKLIEKGVILKFERNFRGIKREGGMVW